MNDLSGMTEREEAIYEIFGHLDNIIEYCQPPTTEVEGL